ncbi:TetR/AcrR family transcriptional regulator [Parasphingorhabdus sp.]|uniref:TetR/AcrR family transcriptional regulator n=1 Tax=Parasphingorhabdus sp. TaxID=2709688 RepID=UPI003BAEF200
MAKNQTIDKNAYHHGDLRAELLRAAETVLSENGIEAFSLRAVAKRAGVSHGAPAHHFNDVKGLLTALATIGYERFIETQNARQRNADTDPRAQLAASGLGYIDFALENPALFQLMFSSQKPDKSDSSLAAVADAAFEKLVDDVGNVHQSNPHENPAMMQDVMAAWAIVHGMADLMIAGRTGRALPFGNMDDSQRDATLSDLILRSIGE